MNADDDLNPTSPSRRSALKIGAATAAGAMVWAEPTIRGLARRPAYAQACSAGAPPVTTVIQSEDALLSATVAVNSNHDGYFGTGFANYNPGGVVDYQNVDGGCGGTATMTIRYAQASGSRTGELFVNGVLLQAITFTATGGWAIWGDFTVSIPLDPGATNTITIASIGTNDMPNVDQITVVSA